MNPGTVDITEIKPDNSVIWNNDEHKANLTPVLEKTKETKFAREDVSAALMYESIFDYQEHHERTPLHTENESLVKGGYTPAPENTNDIKKLNPIDNLNENRLTLLARKYATKDMLPEDIARLNIITQRLRNLMPAITEKDLEVMESLKSKLDHANMISEQLLEKYK